jgi:prolyl oligopeptidase
VVPTQPSYPEAPRLPLVDDLHGVPVPDPYRWLEDRTDTRTEDWLTQQNELMAQERGSWQTTQHFEGRIDALLAAGSISPPYWRGERSFYVRREPGQQFAIVLVIEADGTERVLIDPMQIDPSGLTTLDAWQLSKDGTRLAYQLSEGGTEESVLFVMDVTTGENVDGPIDRCRYTPIAWLPGSEAFYYVRRIAPELLPESEQNFHRRVYLHRVGTSADADVLIFGAGMTMTNYYGVEVSVDGRWLQVSSSEGTEPRNDLWVAQLTPDSIERPSFRLVQGDVDAQSGLDFGRDGRIYVSTDLDAPRGRVCVVDPNDLTQWQDLLPEDDDAVLESFAVLDGAELPQPVLLVSRTRHGIAELALHDFEGAFIEDVPLPGAGTIGGPVEHIDGGPVCWYVYTDNAMVPHVYAYDARTRTSTLHARPPGAVDVPAVHSRQVEYTSKDGTVVRMTIIAPASCSEGPDRPRPTILYGYGGFGVPLTPGYSATTLAWVEAGGVWAIANLRGGSEEGEEWHRDGMLAKKQNVFDDFHAAAEYLAREGWTTPAQLGVYGGSNGGLLVGAAMTQRPELMNAVVCVAPLLDMIRYTTSELGPTWTVEYGDPEDPTQFGWLHAYSPYHRVREGVDYPATMIAVFDNDTRTDPMHGRKMAAAVQHATSGDRPILLRTEGNVGHGARSLSKSVEESAETLAFMAKWTGLEVPS